MLAVAVDELAQVLHAAAHVGGRIEGLAHRQALRGRRHELHQAARALARDGARREVRLRADQGGDEGRVDVLLLRLAVDQRVELGAEEGRPPALYVRSYVIAAFEQPLILDGHAVDHHLVVHDAIDAREIHAVAAAARQPDLQLVAQKRCIRRPSRPARPRRRSARRTERPTTGAARPRAGLPERGCGACGTGNARGHRGIPAGRARLIGRPCPSATCPPGGGTRRRPAAGGTGRPACRSGSSRCRSARASSGGPAGPPRARAGGSRRSGAARAASGARRMPALRPYPSISCQNRWRVMEAPAHGEKQLLRALPVEAPGAPTSR